MVYVSRRTTTPEMTGGYLRLFGPAMSLGTPGAWTVNKQQATDMDLKRSWPDLIFPKATGVCGTDSWRTTPGRSVL